MHDQASSAFRGVAGRATGGSRPEDLGDRSARGAAPAAETQPDESLTRSGGWRVDAARSVASRARLARLSRKRAASGYFGFGGGTTTVTVVGTVVVTVISGVVVVTVCVVVCTTVVG